MSGQAFFYNAVLFTYGLVLSDFYGSGRTRRLVSFSFCGREFPGAAFDWPAVRRHRPTPDDLFTYFVSGALLAVTALCSCTA